MFKFLLLVVLVSLADSSFVRQKNARKIAPREGTDGFIPNVGQYPWVVAITSHYDGFYDLRCSGVLISNEWILTAASCSEEGTDNYYVQIGQVDFSLAERISVPVENFITHPDYHMYDNNIALIRLASPIEFSDTVSAISLPSLLADDTFTGTNAVYVGTLSAGTQDFAALVRYNSLTVISDEECNIVFYPSQSEVCAVGGASNPEQAPCWLDDASILATNVNDEWTLVGLSTLSSCLDFEPALFSRVTLFLDWINDVTGISK